MVARIHIIGGPDEDYMGDCAYCGKHEELRPYGKDGTKICFDCGMKPENKATTESVFHQILFPEKLMPGQNN